MTGIELLADTNFIINLNQGSSLTLPFLNYNFSVSYITEIELLGSFSISKKQKDIYKDILFKSMLGF